jgi:hypothetical protein
VTNEWRDDALVAWFASRAVESGRVERASIADIEEAQPGDAITDALFHVALESFLELETGRSAFF